MKEVDLRELDDFSQERSLLVLSGDRKKFGGCSLDLISGALSLINDANYDDLGKRIQVVLNSFKPSKIIVPHRLNEKLESVIRSLSIQNNYTVEDVNAKSFSDDIERIVDLFLQRNREVYAFLSDLRYSSAYSLARGCLNALVRSVENLDHFDFEDMEFSETVKYIQVFRPVDVLYMDDDSYYALKIFKQLDDPERCLFDLINMTCSSLGYKTMMSWFKSPLSNKMQISQRLAMVQILTDVSNKVHLERLTKCLKTCGNVHHTMESLRSGCESLPTWSSLTKFLESTLEILEVIKNIQETHEFLSQLCAINITELQAILKEIEKTVDFESSKSWKRVYVKDGYNEQLDNLKSQYNNLESVLHDVAFEICKRYQNDTLNAVYIPQLGYLISSELSCNPHESWIEVFRTSTNIYYKDEMMENMDNQFGDIYQLIIDVEIEILSNLQSEIINIDSMLLKIGFSISELDCYCAFANASLLYNYTCPTIVDEPTLSIEKGRHALIERETSFIANDSSLSQNSLAVITGANASGKSIYLAQTGIIVFLAHIGCYVPADKAVIGITDMIITRMMTRESIDRCESTFYSDLKKMSQCLKLQTKNSLLLIDEFGKGTDTIGGPALMGSIIEKFVHSDYTPRTIITTHFHELFTNSTLELNERTKFYHMEILLTKDSEEMTYLYHLKEGLAKESFGIHCAKVCGVNESIIKRAHEIAQDRNDYICDEKYLTKLKVITREFLLWDLENETYTNDQLKVKLQQIMNFK